VEQISSVAPSVPPTGQTQTTNYRTDLKWLSIRQQQLAPVLGHTTHYTGTEMPSRAEQTLREDCNDLDLEVPPMAIEIRKRDTYHHALCS